MTTHFSNNLLKPIKIELRINKSRHPSQNQSVLPNTSFDRNIKLIILSDPNQKKLIVFSYLLQNFEAIIHYIELIESWQH